MQETKTFKQSELVLNVGRVYNTNMLDYSKWKPFVNRLCGDRVYQKEAIENAQSRSKNCRYHTSGRRTARRLSALPAPERGSARSPDGVVLLPR